MAKIIMDVQILCGSEASAHGFGGVRKEWETDLVPVVGMEIEDPAWKEPRTIKHVTLNPAEGYYYVYARVDTQPNEARCKEWEKMYVAHGWTPLSSVKL